jgi:hypothetical protein
MKHTHTRTHTHAHYTPWDSSGRGICPLQIPLSDKTQQSQQTDIRASGWIRTRKPSKPAATHSRLRPCSGPWDQQTICSENKIHFQKKKIDKVVCKLRHGEGTSSSISVGTEIQFWFGNKCWRTIWLSATWHMNQGSMPGKLSAGILTCCRHSEC